MRRCRWVVKISESSLPFGLCALTDIVRLYICKRRKKNRRFLRSFHNQVFYIHLWYAEIVRSWKFLQVERKERRRADASKIYCWYFVFFFWLFLFCQHNSCFFERGFSRSSWASIIDGITPFTWMKVDVKVTLSICLYRIERINTFDLLSFLYVSFSTTHLFVLRLNNEWSAAVMLGIVLISLVFICLIYLS